MGFDASREREDHPTGSAGRGWPAPPDSGGRSEMAGAARQGTARHAAKPPMGFDASREREDHPTGSAGRGWPAPPDSGGAKRNGGRCPSGHRPPCSEATHGIRTHDLCFTKALLYR